jgi:23S rRNA (pseudouridine1915-N3)-methyltransferase
MKINLIAVGTRMPDWVNQGVAEYSKRLPRDFSLEIVEVPLAHRGKSADIAKAMEKEGEALMQAAQQGDYVVSLDVKGKHYSTEELAGKIGKIRDESLNLTLLVGGPDGLSRECLQQSRELWSLSALTLPHPIVRVVVAEQIYRVWSFLNNHPYHRA